MPKYQIHIDPKLPGPEQIARHKDFKKLYGDYRSATRFKFWRELRTNPRYFATLVMIVAVGTLVWQSFQRDDQANLPLIQAPFAVEIPFKTFDVPAAQGREMQVGPLGFSVPPQAFESRSGVPVTSGNVRLGYRVLKDPADFFLAGIPLHLAPQPETETQYLEASPVIELRAFQGSDTIQLREGVSILLTFEGSARDTNLISYWLDETAGGWIAHQTPERVSLFDEQAVLTNLPHRPRLRRVQSDEVPVEELRPKGVDAPAATAPAPDPNADFAARMAAWEAMRDDAIETAQKSAPMEIRFSTSKLGYFALAQVLERPISPQPVKLLDNDGKRLGPSLVEAGSSVWLYEPGISTLRPCAYNGEGRHILDRMTRGTAQLWMRLPGGSLGIAPVNPGETEQKVFVEATPASWGAGRALLIKP